MINAALKSAEAKQYWSIPGWLPEAIGVIVDNGKFFCFEGEDLRLHLQKGLHVVKVYDLVGIVADVNSGEHQKSHLVSIINGDFVHLGESAILIRYSKFIRTPAFEYKQLASFQ